MKRNSHFTKTSGFTLIELMIVVAIIGIVAAIAYPNYNQHILRSHRVEGKELLTRTVQLQESFFAENNTYTSTLTELGFTNPTESENGYYSLSVDAATAACPLNACYSITVTAQNGQIVDGQCATMTLSSTGRKTATNADCW